MSKPFSIIVAFDSRYGIGKNGQMAWHLPMDMKRFKEITTAVKDPARQNAVIMGRKTWESLPSRFRPLPDRVNLVLSQTGGLKLGPGVLRSDSLDAALSQLSSASHIEGIFVIGGSQIFAQAIEHPLCEKLYVTHVKGDFSCDVFFPRISPQFFPIGASEEHAENSTLFHFSDYIRHL